MLFIREEVGGGRGATHPEGGIYELERVQGRGESRSLTWWSFRWMITLDLGVGLMVAREMRKKYGRDEGTR